MQIEDEYEAVCERIREKEGFRNFLLPPRIDEIQAAAREGMIVVISDWTILKCDAGFDAQ